MTDSGDVIEQRGPVADAFMLCASFAPEAASVPAARAFVRDSLANLPASTIDVAALLVTELATNAVLHGRTVFEIEVEIGERVVRVTVTDRGGGHPVIAHGREVGGWGLPLVDAAAERWGVSLRDAHTAVWFETPTAPNRLPL